MKHLALITLLCLSACSDVEALGAAPACSAASVPSLDAGAPVARQMVGDSITAAWNTTADPDPGLPTDMTAVGVGGTSACSFTHGVLTADTTTVIVALGTNDCNSDTAVQRTVECYRAVIAHLATHYTAAEYLVSTVLPLASTESNALRRRACIRRLNVEIRKLGYRVIDSHAALADANDWLPAALTADGLHLNVAGYTVWRAYLCAFFGGC